MNHSFCLLFLISLFTLHSSPASATPIAGTLTTNASWTASNNPYVITGNFTVASGVRLTLNPNVIIQVGSGFVFDVQGTLTATGYPTAPISFTNVPGDTVGGWLGLTGVGGAQSATGTLSYCRFNNLAGILAAVSATNAYVDVSHCTTRTLPGRFIFAINSRLNITQNEIYDIADGVLGVACAGNIASNNISKINGDFDGINLDQLWTGSGSSNVTVIGNVISNAANSGADAIDLGTVQATLDGNVLKTFGDKGVSLGGSAVVTLRNNIMFGCAIGVAIKDAVVPTMANNTIVSCPIGIRSSNTNLVTGTASNMIIWNCATSINLQGSATLSVGASTVGGTNVWPGAGNTTNNPLFVDQAAGRLRLLPTSPARNAGVIEGWMASSTDVGRQTRIQEGQVDRGAHEFTPNGEVDVEYPNSRDVFSAGALVPVGWMVYGTNWPSGSSVVVQVSSDDGTSWVSVTSAVTSTPYVVTQTTWNSTNPPGSEYCRIRVVTTNGASDQSDVCFTLVPPTAAYFGFGAISSPQSASVPFPIRVIAYGTNGAVASSYLGTNSLRGATGTGSLDVVVGTNNVPWDYPFQNYFMTARIQTLYQSSQVGGAMVIDGLQLILVTNPAQPLTHFTIRMKETTLSSYPTSTLPVWTNNNWTTVYQADTTVSSTGKVTFIFTTPYSYSGLSNLFVDISYSNDYFTFSADVLTTTNSQPRTLYFAADDSDGYGDPLAWVGPASPAPNTYFGYPDIHFLSSGAAGVGISPTQLVPFVNGVWAGSATVQGQITNIFFRTDDGQGHTGQSTAFVVGGGAQSLVVSSMISGATPSVGTNFYIAGSVVTCSVPVMVEIPLATQFVATGWAGSGNVPVSGTGTTVSFTITTNSSISWNWITSRVYVAVATQGNGTVDVPAAWMGPSSNFTRTVTPGANYSLASWTGTTNGCVMTSNQISGLVLYKRDIIATFQAGFATNGVPVSWILQYYPGTNNVDNAAMSDTDGDGMAAWKEWRSGTDPTVSTSVFEVVRFVLSNGLPTLTWSSVTNKTYFIRATTNMKSGVWTTLSTGVPATNAFLQLTPSNRASEYKIGVE